jgi:hypothetical protein
MAHELALGVAGELEYTAAHCEDAPRAVADDEARRGRRVVVVQQLEEEPEAAAAAADGGGVGQARAPVVVDRPLLAVGADEVRQAAQSSRGLTARRAGRDGSSAWH